MQHPTDACPWNASGAEETGRVAKQGASHRCGTQVTPRREAPAGDRDTCRRDAEGAITPYRAKGVPTRPMWPRRGLTEEGEAVRRGGENSVMLPRSAPNQHTCPASGCEQRVGRAVHDGAVLARTGSPFAGLPHHTLSSRSLEEVSDKCAWVTRDGSGPGQIHARRKGRGCDACLVCNMCVGRRARLTSPADGLAP